MDFTLPIIFLAVLLGFLMQTIAGFSGSLIALPILVLVMDVKQAVGLMTVLLFFFSAILVYQTRKSIDKKIFFQTVIYTLPGLVLGILLISYGSPIFLKRILGAFLIVYVLISIFEKKRFDFISKLGFPFSFVAGIFSGMFATGGGIFIMYLNTKITESKPLRATLIALLGTNNLIRLPVLAYTGVVTIDSLKLALICIPVFAVAVFLGEKVFSKIDDTAFRNIVLGLLAAGGLSLLFA